MANLDLKFEINGGVSQRINILTDETPEQFFKKIEDGDYLTSINRKTVIDVNDMSTGNFKEVGIIEDQVCLDDTEYDDFEME